LLAASRFPVHVDHEQVEGGKRVALVNVLPVPVVHAADVIDGNVHIVDTDFQRVITRQADCLELYRCPQLLVAEVFGHSETALSLEYGGAAIQVDVVIVGEAGRRFPWLLVDRIEEVVAVSLLNLVWVPQFPEPAQ